MIKKILLSFIILSVTNISFASNDKEEGYQYQANIINSSLEKNAFLLDKTYDFQDITVNDKFLPLTFCNDKALGEIISPEISVEIKKDMQCEKILYPKVISDPNETKKRLLTWRDILLFPSNKLIINFKDSKDFKLGINKANNEMKDNFVILTKMQIGMMVYKSSELRYLMTKNM